MMKTAIVGSMLVAAALSTYISDIDNNLIEYELEDIQPMQTISLPPLPYPYNDRNHFIIKPAPITHKYTGHNKIIIPTPTVTEVEVSSQGFVSTAISCVVGAVKSALSFLLVNAPALFAGSIVALGVCKMTSLCGPELTIVEVQRELRSIATPERMTSVTNFVKEAIRKYSEMQS